MCEDQIDFILSKMLSGEATPEEVKKIEQWRDASEQNKVLYRHFVGLSGANSKHEDLEDRDELFQEVWSRVKKYPDRQVHIHRYWGMKIAASVILVAFLGIFVRYMILKGKNTRGNIAYVVKHNVTGQKSKIFLPDGSVVWLNSESTIKYEKGLKGEKRKVYLEGEAFFTVKKDSFRPFNVISRNVLVTVLGTKFNVNTFKANRVEVALEEGKVNVGLFNKSLNKSSQSVDLMPGEMARIHTDDDEIIKTDFHKCAVFGWKDGILFFHKDNFDDIIGKLERWYGVKFLYEERPQKDWNFSGSFKNEYLDNVLTTLAFSENFKFNIKGDTVKLKF